MMKLKQNLLLSLCFSISLQAAVYEVGPGKPYQNIGSVPWSKLVPGDTVLIHWQSTPYAEKWAISVAGAEGAPITVRGVPNSSGVKPIITGQNATTAPGRFTNEDRGVLKIGTTSAMPDARPRHLVIENLDIRYGKKGTAFKTSTGADATYAVNAAAIYVERGSHITIRSCTIRNSSNGLLVSGGAIPPNENYLIEKNYFYSNGNAGSSREHHSYTSVVGIVFHANRFAPLADKAEGNAIKDRSAGLVVRYNWIHGANRHLDLVDANSSLIVSDPGYRESFVYGNTFIENSETSGGFNRQIVHYGGDSSNTLNYRKGTLYFYNNTVVSKRTGKTAIFRSSTMDQRIDARNNIFYVTAAGSNLLVADVNGRVELHRNWMKPGWKNGESGFTGTVVDDGSTITSDSPGFYNEASEVFQLTADSPNVDAATLLDPLVMPANNVMLEYKKHYGTVPRAIGARLDVGAFEKR